MSSTNDQNIKKCRSRKNLKERRSTKNLNWELLAEKPDIKLDIISPDINWESLSGRKKHDFSWRETFKLSTFFFASFGIVVLVGYKLGEYGITLEL